ncbi:unnamed protein product [Mycena citricolor]|uniref:Uncharacterized protein n=1 Tax=Mycena citricolor TaxID=2018698 RepID=A0AAD2HEA6_9AGAR|nr:unnamed protein product [Mycena citricolor]
MTFVKITEQASLHDNLEQKSVRELLEEINEEDRKVPEAVGKAIRRSKNCRHERPARRAGRLGDPADLRDAADAGRRPDRRRRHGVAESGGTRRRRSAAGLARTAGTEYLAARHGDRHRGIGHDPQPGLPAGRRSRYSDRNDRRAGTGHRQFADEIGNRAEADLQHDYDRHDDQAGPRQGNRMVNMQLTNDKLVDRGTRMVADELGLGYEQAKRLLLLHGSARKAIDAYRESQS